MEVILAVVLVSEVWATNPAGVQTCHVIEECKPCPESEMEQLWCLDTGLRRKLYCDNGEKTDQIMESCTEVATSDFTGYLLFWGSMILLFVISYAFIIYRKRLIKKKHQNNIQNIFRN